MNEQPKQFKETTLTRTGQRAVVFNGIELWSGTNRSNQGPNENRWIKATVHETDTKKIVVGVAHITCWQGESDRYEVTVVQSKEEAVTYLEEHAGSLAEEAAEKLGVSERI